MTQKLITLLFVATSLSMAGCSLSDHEMKEGWWKYGQGYHVGDVIDFKENFSISRDTLYRDGQIIGTVIRKRRGWFGFENEIEIRALDGKQSGVYYKK